MPQAHVKTMQPWLTKVRKENSIPTGLKVFFTDLATVDDAQIAGIVRTIANGGYNELAQALTENTAYSTAGSTTSAKGGT